MNFMRFCKLHTKYIIVGVQIIILFFALSSWILHRGNAYGKVFALDEYILRDNVVVGEDVTTDEIMGESGVFLSTPALHLEKGIYQIHVNYNADRVGNIINVSCDLGTMECFAPPMELDPSVHSSIMTAEITRSTDDLRIEAFFSGSGYISITNMEIYETSGRIYFTLSCYAALYLWPTALNGQLLLPDASFWRCQGFSWLHAILFIPIFFQLVMTFLFTFFGSKLSRKGFLVEHFLSSSIRSGPKVMVMRLASIMVTHCFIFPHFSDCLVFLSNPPINILLP